MPNIQTQAYLRNYIQSNIENGAWKFGLRIATHVFDWTLTFASGYELEKFKSTEKKDIWTYAELFGIFTLISWIWIIKFCCLNRFCITCCVKCCVRCSQRGRQEEMQMRNRDEDDDESTESVGIVKRVLNILHMILNRLGIGAVGFEAKRHVFTFKPFKPTWKTWLEMSLVGIFCIWILSIKYCILKCYCLKCCCPCIPKCGSKNAAPTIADHNGAPNVNNVEVRN